MTTEKINWLRLIRSENIGPKNFFDFIKVFGTAEKALEAIPDMAARAGKKRPIVLCSVENAEKELAKLEKYGAEIIAYNEPEYPELLKHISDAPPVITIKGDKNIFRKKTIGIVGARNASANACLFSAKIARDLGNAGYAVASGLARGIDTHAHKGALPSGTIAVIAGGIDNIYPPENEKLYDDIAATGGAIVSELPFGTVPRAQNFPQRNRIIAGLSLGVLVVEAALKSGSLITARLALEYGREVFAVPGSPLDPRCSGTNSLLKKGATLTENFEDIVSGLNFMNQNLSFAEKEQREFSFGSAQLPEESELEKIRREILEKLSSSAVDVDELVRLIDKPLNNILAVILELELAGKVERQSGNKVSLVYSEDSSSLAR